VFQFWHSLVRLDHVSSGYARLGQDRAVYICLALVKPDYVRMCQVNLGWEK